MQVAVTGAAGLLGRRVVDTLLARGHLAGAEGAPTPIDRIVASDIGGLDVFADPRVVQEAGDIADPELLARAVPAGTGAIFHLAATFRAMRSRISSSACGSISTPRVRCSITCAGRRRMRDL